MKKFRVPVEWSMQSYVVFEAENREEAASLAEIISPANRPEGYFLEGSLRARREEIELVLPRSIEDPRNFMQPYVYHGDVLEVEEDGMLHVVPWAEAEYEDKRNGVLYRDVCYGRLSADEYSDCTPWVWGTSEDDVLDELEELHGNEEPPFKLIEGGKK